MKTDNLIPAAPLDRRELAPGVQLCFTRLDAPLCPPPLDWPRLLVFDFCRSGRRAIPDGAQYAIVTEGHAAVSFAVPGADFYLPGSQYEALQLFIDPDAVQADSFLTLMGLEIGGIADYFCRGGVHCCPMSDAITAIVDEVWDDAAYAAPGELRYAAVRLLYELLRLPDEADTARCPARPEMSIIFNLYFPKSSLTTNSTTNYEYFHKYPPFQFLFSRQNQQFQLAAHAKFILWVKNIFSLCCLLRSPPPLRIIIDVLLCSPNV